MAIIVFNFWRREGWWRGKGRNQKEDRAKCVRRSTSVDLPTFMNIKVKGQIA